MDISRHVSIHVKSQKKTIFFLETPNQKCSDVLADGAGGRAHWQLIKWNTLDVTNSNLARLTSNTEVKISDWEMEVLEIGYIKNELSVNL